jgi:hypothetical protein
VIRRPTRRRTGLTLVELTMSLGVVSIVLIAVGSILSVSSRMWPQPDDPHAVRGGLTAALSLITRDAVSAVGITALSARGITLLVPDRDGDNDNELVEYSWSGLAGQPLMRCAGGGSAVPLGPGLDSFSIAATVSETQTSSAQTVSGAELVVFLADAPPANTVDISSLLACGQCFTPTLPADAVAARVTSVDVEMRRGISGSVLVSLRDSAGDVPSAATLASATVADAAMSTSVAWQRVNFTTPALVRSGQRVCVTVEHVSGIVGARVAYQAPATPPAGSWAVSRLALLAPWGTHSTAMMGVRVRAQPVSPSTTTTVRRVESIVFQATASADPSRAVPAVVSMPNRPEAP